jgi:hypothetical protein
MQVISAGLVNFVRKIDNSLRYTGLLGIGERGE